MDHSNCQCLGSRIVLLPQEPPPPPNSSYMRSPKFGFAETVLSRARKPPFCPSQDLLHRTYGHHHQGQQLHHVLRVRPSSPKSSGRLAASFTSSAVEQGYHLHPSPSPSSCSSPRGSIRVHNSLADGCLAYERSWAWQQFLLSRRLEYRRRRNLQQQQQHEQETPNNEGRRSHDDDDVDVDGHDRDCVLMLEVAPVYTLGRGADETHLTFLNRPANNNNEGSHGDGVEEALSKLSRRARGPGTARLSLDRGRIQEELFLLHCDGDGSGRIITPQRAMDVLAESACPVLAPNGVPIFRVDRGGEVTFHGPSQLVVYPLLDLQRPPYRADLHWYLRMVEEVIIRTLAHYGIDGHRDEINTGVWVADGTSRSSDGDGGTGATPSNKVAAVGISSSRWITTHGFALNVDPDLDYFDTSILLPCGIEGRGVTSMAKILRSRNQPVPTMHEVADTVTFKLQEVFGVEVMLQ
jgi:lipoate-protein ligase B